MYSTYRLNTDDLSADFIEAVKKVYQHRNVEIIIQDIEDETDYLMKSPENHARLLKAMDNIKQNNNIVELPLDDL